MPVTHTHTYMDFKKRLEQEKYFTHLNRINPNINNYCTGLYPATLHHIWLPYSWDDNICLSSDLLGILGSGMDNTNSSIFPLPTKTHWEDNIRRAQKKKAIREHDRLVQWDRIFTCSSRAAGIPTMLLLPITTALFPFIWTPYLCNNSMHPLGVHGTNKGSLPRMARRPMFNGWNPSTSFSIQTAFKMFFSSICWSKECNRHKDYILIKKEDKGIVHVLQFCFPRYTYLS